jgi:hypothetical protein
MQKLIFIMSALIYIISPTTAFADICVCEVMSHPDEMKWYEKGCSIWLNRQSNCSVKVSRTQLSGSQFEVPKSKDKVVRLGFVGHWSNTSQTENYLSGTLLPFMKKSGKSVVFDNTACSGHDDSDRLVSFVKSTVQPKMQKNQYLSLKGHQSISIGLWDSVLGESFNFYSSLDSRTLKIEYPSCEKFENQRCLERGTFLPWTQKDQTGFCKNERQQLVQLRCEDSHYTNSNGMVFQALMWKFHKTKRQYDEEKLQLKRALEKAEREELLALEHNGLVKRYVLKHKEVEANVLLQISPDQNDLSISYEKSKTFDFPNIDLIKKSKGKFTGYYHDFSGTKVVNCEVELNTLDNPESKQFTLQLNTNSKGCKRAFPVFEKTNSIVFKSLDINNAEK